MTDSESSAVYQLPSPGAGVSGFRLVFFLSRLLPAWYGIFLILSALLALVPLLFFDETTRTVTVFLGFSAPLVFAVVLSPLIRVRYMYDVVRRIEVSPLTAVVETFAMDYRWPLDSIDVTITDGPGNLSIHIWMVKYKDVEVRLRVWVPEGVQRQLDAYRAIKFALSSRVGAHFQDKETAQQR